ncbi:hypothetical protein WA158_001931 [Blastocystis sp. Blastoise]
MSVESKKAIILKPTEENYKIAAEALHKGQLVAFPTETVYGLGANALNRESCCDIFKVKNRPFNDPVIVHVACLQEALDLIDICEEDRKVFTLLANSFWPGPLTIVAKAKPCLPLELSAGTGAIGFRCPSHPVAHKLIEVSHLPIAAPSANLFGHVSPTTADHVYKDLGTNPIYILDGGETGLDCSVGIESTVMKVETQNNKIVLFRRGGISENDIYKCLCSNGYSHLLVDVVKKQVKSRADKGKDGVDYKEEHVTLKGEQAPGQLLTHYAPYIQTYLVKRDSNTKSNEIFEHIDKCIIIDFAGILKDLSGKAHTYMTLSEDNNIHEATKNLYRAFRDAEIIKGANYILLPDLSEYPDELAPAIMDRMFRAASGRVIMLNKLE